LAARLKAHYDTSAAALRGMVAWHSKVCVARYLMPQPRTPARPGWAAFGAPGPGVNHKLDRDP